MRVLRRAVAFDAMAAVWFDPTAALPVDTWIDDSMIDDAGLHLAEIERDAADIDKFIELGASGRRAARLSEAPDGGDRERPPGVGDELRVVDFGDSGLRGGFVLYRRQGAPDFTTRDVSMLASLKGECAEVAAREARARPLRRRRRQRSRPAGARRRRWPRDGRRCRHRLARRTGSHRPAAPPRRDGGGRTRARDRIRAHTDAAATVRVRARSGRWVLVRGSALGNGGRPLASR